MTSENDSLRFVFGKKKVLLLHLSKLLRPSLLPTAVNLEGKLQRPLRRIHFTVLKLSQISKYSE